MSAPRAARIGLGLLLIGFLGLVAVHVAEPFVALAIARGHAAGPLRPGAVGRFPPSGRLFRGV